MARRKAAAKKKARKKSGEAMIISKARVKAAVRKCNVAGDFYDGLEDAVRELISRAEGRALANKRKTVRATDV